MGKNTVKTFDSLVAPPLTLAYERERPISKKQLDEMFRAKVENGSTSGSMAWTENIHVHTNDEQETAETTPVEILLSKQTTASASGSFDDINFPKTDPEEDKEDCDFFYSEEMLEAMGKKKRKEIEKLLRKRERDLRKLEKIQTKRALLYLKQEEKEIKAEEKKLWAEWHKEVLANVKKAKNEKTIKEKETKKARKERNETRKTKVHGIKGILGCFVCFSH